MTIEEMFGDLYSIDIMAEKKTGEIVSSLMKTKNVLELSWDEWMMNIEVDDMEDSIEKVAELLRERKI